MKLYHLIGEMPLCTNTFLLIADNANAAVIDPACNLKTYTDILSENGATLTHILLTHGHYDHVTSAKQLKDVYGAKIYMGSTDTKTDEGYIFPLEKKDCDFDYEDGQFIDIGDISIKVFRTPGHSNGSVCLYIEEENLLFTGDTIFKHEIGRCDLKDGDFSKMLQSLKKIKDNIKGDPKIFPGHEDFSSLQDELINNPYFKQI